MPILEPHHDLAHDVESDGAWSESYYFNAYDPATDTGFFTRVGIRPNEGTMDVGLSVWLPDGDLAEYRQVVACDQMVGPPLVVGGVRYDVVETMKQWRLTADVSAPVRNCLDASEHGRTATIDLDVVFENLTAPIGSDGGQSRGRGSAESGSAAATTGTGHFEQAGRWTGSLDVDGHRFEWTDARGNRDRSWGPRRWGGPQMWRWFSINIDDDLHFGGIRLGTEAGDLHRGWVSSAGTAASVREWQIATDTADDGVTQRVVNLRVIDKSDHTYELTGKVLRVADIGRPPGTLVNEGLTEWTYHRDDGTSVVGYGIAEYLHQVDERGFPRVPVA